jgi:hypothetical protein
VKPNPGTNFKAFVLDRVRSFGLVVAIGFLLMVSLAVTAGTCGSERLARPLRPRASRCCGVASACSCLSL